MAPTNNNPQNYFKAPIFYLLLGGISIYDIENPAFRTLHRMYSFLLLLTCGYGYILTEILHIVKHFQEMDELTLTLCYLFAHAIAIGKVLALTIRRKAIGSFLKSLESKVFLPDVERGGIQEVNIIDGAVSQTRTQARVFATVVVLMLATKIIPCMKNTTTTKVIDNKTEIVPVFPYPSTLPFPVDYGTTPFYELAFFYQFFCIALFGWYLGTTDTIITGLMIHATAQLKIVINAILTVADRAERITNKLNLSHLEARSQTLITYTDCKNRSCTFEKNDKFGKEYMTNLRICVNSCVNHHHATIKLLEDLEDTFSLLFLLQFFGTLLSLCVGLYQCSVSPITNPRFVSMSSFTTAMAFQLLVYCYNGNEISLHSAEVSRAAYNCRWVQSDRGIKTSLMLIMMRAQRPFYLTSGKFSKISLETFTTILRGSVSYFMVLRKMNEGQNVDD